MNLIEKYLGENIGPTLVKPPKGQRFARVFFSWDKSGHNSYLLGKDYWFRKDYGPAEGYGMMFRKPIKLLKPQRYDVDAYTVRKISFKHYPTEYTMGMDWRDDEPKNWKRDTGWLWVSNEMGMPEIEDVVKWMNKNTDKWKP